MAARGAEGSRSGRASLDSLRTSSPSRSRASGGEQGEKKGDKMEYHINVNGAKLVLHENGSTAEELSDLLTARFGKAEAKNSQAVALEDSATALVFPLNVVATRPDFVASSENLLVLFSWTPQTIILQELRKKGMLSEQEVRTLTPLCEDPYVTAAFEVFREEGDEADLVDTLQRIVAIRLSRGAQQKSPSSYAPEDPASSQSSSALQRPTGDELLQQLTAALKLDKFPSREIGELCGKLQSEEKITGDEAVVLDQLVRKELPHLQAAYEIFLEERNETDLIKSLKRVAKHFGIERVVRGQPYANAVLSAFARGDPMVSGAWDVYVDEHNEDDFRDTLHRCYARLKGRTPQMQPTESAEQDRRLDALYSTKPSEEKNSLRKLILWLHQVARITSEDGQALMAAVDAGEPPAEEAMHRFLTSKRTDEDSEDLVQAVMALLREIRNRDDVQEKGMTEESEAADQRGLEELYGENPEQDEVLRESMMLFLDDMCENKQLLNQEDAEKLKVLVDAGDARLLAAFDLFNEERDLDDLVDTLQRLADRVVLVSQEERDEEEGEADDDADEDDIEDDNEDDGEEYDLESLFDIIVQMDLPTDELEIVRDAMEMRHPALEAAIDNFARTNDRDAFKAELERFCRSQM